MLTLKIIRYHPIVNGGIKFRVFSTIECQYRFFSAFAFVGIGIGIGIDSLSRGRMQQLGTKELSKDSCLTV